MPNKTKTKMKGNFLLDADFIKLVDELKFSEIIDKNIRKVKWLYNNSNKYTDVVNEKIVRLMIHKYEERIAELESIIKMNAYIHGR